MALREILKEHKKKIFLIILFILPFIILIPGNFRIISPLLGKTSGYEVVIDRVSYTSEGFANNQSNLIIGNLYQPTPKYSNKTYPAIIFCPGYSLGFGKETSKRWAIELARRDFVVLSIDLPGNGMSIGNMDLLPRSDLEPKIIQGAINYLKNLSFVDSNDIGLLGYSYGGSAVLLSSGILGDQINATVSLNGFANFTNWLINGILPSLNIDFKVYSDNITLLNMNDQPITPQNIHEIDNLYGLFRGDTSTINNLIIPNSTALNRTFLKKFNAVDYLPNVRNDSVMFIHSLYDTTFHNTNQSGQGYKSIISHNKTAYYIPVKDGHDFTKDPNRTVDYCTINFFEEKLKNVSLGENWASPLAKYSQKRNITLTTDLYPFSSLMIQNGILYGFSFLPFIGFMYIIYQEKKVSTKRAMIDKEIVKKKKENGNYEDLTFGRGSYKKTYLFLSILTLIYFIAVVGGALHYFPDLIMITMAGLFYLTMLLVFYYIPDKKEVELWEEMREKDDLRKNIHRSADKSHFNLIYFTFFIVLIAIILIIGRFFLINIKIFNKPLEQIFTPMLYLGISFLILGLLFIIFTSIRKNSKKFSMKVNWARYNLKKYEILKDFSKGVLIFLNILFLWNYYAFLSELPMFSPHSVYYIYAFLAIGLFFAGTYLILKIINKDFVNYIFSYIIFKGSKSPIIKKTLKCLVAFILGCFLYTLISLVVFEPLLDFTLFGNFTWIVLVIFLVSYTITYLLDLTKISRGIFGFAVFLPLIAFNFLLLFFHI